MKSTLIKGMDVRKKNAQKTVELLTFSGETYKYYYGKRVTMHEVKSRAGAEFYHNPEVKSCRVIDREKMVWLDLEKNENLELVKRVSVKSS